LTWEQFLQELWYLLPVLISALLGFVIGLERKFRLKEAGIRTHTIVCIGSALMMVVSKYAFGGQTADVELTGKEVSPEKLDFIYRLKTGALLEVSMMIGAILGGADREQVKAVEKIASCVGTAFQIQDDILDVVGDARVIGKPVLSDEKNEKTTYVTLYGMEAARKAVMELSKEAEEILESLPGDHEFLSCLIDILITRVK